MSNSLSSIGALAYQGTNATMPPNVFIFNNNQPAVTDWRNFALGDLWINRIQQNINNSEIYVLLGVASNRANWALLTNSNGNINHVTTDSGTVIPVAGNINLFGGHDIYTEGSGSTATVNLTNAIILGDLTPIPAGSDALFADTGNITISAGNLNLPAYNSAGTQGVIEFAGVRFVTTDGIDNQFIGINAGNLTMTGGNNTLFGAASLRSATTSSDNTLIGNQIMTTATSGADNNLIIGGGAYNVGTSSSNVIIGNNALALATTATSNTVLGTSCGYNAAAPAGLLTGDFNIMIGFNAASTFTGNESHNVTISSAGVLGDSGVIRIGTLGTQTTNYQAGISGVSVSSLTSSLPVQINSSGQLGATGNIYLPDTNTAGTQGVVSVGGLPFISNYGVYNTFVGQQSGNTTLTGSSNSSLGAFSLGSLTSGVLNTAIGAGSLSLATTSSGNCAVGQESLWILVSGSGENVAMGNLAGGQLLTGSGNVLLGFQAGYAYDSSESDNVNIANKGITADSGVIRLGTAGTQTSCYVAGITGVSVTGAPVIVSASGQLGITVSSMRYKNNIHDLNGQSSNIYKLRPVSFNYIAHPEHESWGLIAEEVEQVMPQLVVYNKDQQCETVKYQDLPVLLLNEIQKLAKKNDDMLKRIQMLESKLSEE